MQGSWQMAAETLTQEAVLAAEAGRWNIVDACYRQRAELFRINDVPRSLAQRLCALDEVIQDRLRMATMTVQHLLSEVASKQRCLERFDVVGDPALSRSHRVNRLV